MAIVRIVEIWQERHPRVREAEVPEEYLSEMSTFLYKRGAHQTTDPRRNSREGIQYYEFQVASPSAEFFTREMEKKWPIKFVQIREKK